MKGGRWLFLAVGTVVTFILFLVLTLCLVPDREVQGLATRLLEREGYSLRATRFGKAFPLGIKAVDLEISGEKGPLLSAGTASVRLRLLPLLTGRLSFTCEARIGTGRISGDYSLRNGEARMEASRILLEDIPFFRTVTDTQARGELRLNGRFIAKGKEAGGELRLEVKGAHVGGVKIGGIPLPDADYSLVQGMLRARGGVVRLESFTLQGEGLYVRLKGDFPFTTPPDNAPLNLPLELMPKAEFLEKQKFVFLLLSKYLISPGNYRIPIRGTLAKPMLQ